MSEQSKSFFQLQATDRTSDARAGLLNLGALSVETPLFMPVGTLGSVKGIDHRQLLDPQIDARILLANAYHLYLRPGIEVIKSAGGLHRFMGWERGLLTDSGGYQIFSLSKRCKIEDEGISFASPIDGSTYYFTPEQVIDIQQALGANIIVPLDECTPYDMAYSDQKKALYRTQKWLDRSMHHLEVSSAKDTAPQQFFPIIQGGLEEDLRKEATAYVCSLEVSGYAIGGLSVGEPAEMMYRTIEWITPLLPKQRPRYLMGVGTPTNLLRCISRGVDLFDCVLPTRNGRNGTIFTTKGVLNMRNAQWRTAHEPLDTGLQHPISQHYSKSYLRHLFISGERLAEYIASMQNIAFYMQLMRDARKHILAGDFHSWAEESDRCF